MGRPREFCLHDALEKALEVFWRRGFAGATLAELTAAMGITRPSLYACYGNKEELFRKALDLYDAKHMGFLRDALGRPTAREAALAVLLGMAGATAADAGIAGEHPAGCLSVSGTLACSVAAEPIRVETQRRRRLFEGELARRFATARADGDLDADGDPAVLAGFVMTVACGIACQAVAGVPYTTLRAMAEMALAAWPDARPSLAAEIADRQVAPIPA